MYQDMYGYAVLFIVLFLGGFIWEGREGETAEGRAILDVTQ